MPKVVPIRADLGIVVHINGTKSYVQETRDCERYELNLCRVCENPRLNLSPWCDEHFPWTDQKPRQLHSLREKEGT